LDGLFLIIAGGLSVICHFDFSLFGESLYVENISLFVVNNNGNGQAQNGRAGGFGFRFVPIISTTARAAWRGIFCQSVNNRGLVGAGLLCGCACFVPIPAIIGTDARAPRRPHENLDPALPTAAYKFSDFRQRAKTGISTVGSL